MLSRYRAHLRHRDRYGVGDLARPLTREALGDAFVRTVIHEFTPAQDGYDLELGMRDAPHERVLETMRQRLGRLGVEFADALISEWVSHTVAGAVAGSLASGTAALAGRQGAAATAAYTTIGTAIGAFVGSLVHEEVARYLAQRDPWSVIWHIQAQPALTTPRFAVSFA